MNILVPDISIAEKVLRAAVVYAFLLVAFRPAASGSSASSAPSTSSSCS